MNGSVCGPNPILCMFGKWENERYKQKKTNSLLGKLNYKPQRKQEIKIRFFSLTKVNQKKKSVALFPKSLSDYLLTNYLLLLVTNIHGEVTSLLRLKLHGIYSWDSSTE